MCQAVIVSVSVGKSAILLVPFRFQDPSRRFYNVLPSATVPDAVPQTRNFPTKVPLRRLSKHTVFQSKSVLKTAIVALLSSVQDCDARCAVFGRFFERNSVPVPATPRNLPDYLTGAPRDSVFWPFSSDVLAFYERSTDSPGFLAPPRRSQW